MMFTNNKEALKTITKEWYESLTYRHDGAELTEEQRERASKNAARNAKRSLKMILKDRISILNSLPPGEVGDRAIKHAEAQLKELEEYSKPRQNWEQVKSNNGKIYRRTS